jgi:hypothetical protein
LRRKRSDESKGGAMNCLRPLPCGIAAAFLVGASAGATPLTIVTVNAPAINCVFETDCTVVVNDSIGTIPLLAATGTARLQSRTFAGQPGAPGAGKTAYEYRLDLTQAQAANDAVCVTDLTVDFGPVSKLRYNSAGPPDDVFVVTKGAVGSIGLAAAEQAGNLVTFTFSQPVCAADASGPGQTTFFFGLASAHAPKGIVAAVGAPGADPMDAKARAPAHR